MISRECFSPVSVDIKKKKKNGSKGESKIARFVHSNKAMQFQSASKPVTFFMSLELPLIKVLRPEHIPSFLSAVQGSWVNSH